MFSALFPKRRPFGVLYGDVLFKWVSLWVIACRKPPFCYICHPPPPPPPRCSPPLWIEKGPHVTCILSKSGFHVRQPFWTTSGSFAQAQQREGLHPPPPFISIREVFPSIKPSTASEINNLVTRRQPSSPSIAPPPTCPHPACTTSCLPLLPHRSYSW